MRVAVLTLTRDRLEYTKHCFARLQELAGIDFDHYVLDQGSTDGTPEWLEHEWMPANYAHRFVSFEPSNIGIHRGLNKLLDRINGEDYDVVVKFDPDCEVVTPDTLRRCCEFALAHDAIVSPEIHGLRSVQFPLHDPYTVIGAEAFVERAMIGGIFMAIPATVFSEQGYTFDESAPMWGTDDDRLCEWFRHVRKPRPSDDGLNRVGYLIGCRANHFESTDGQHDRFPEYFERRVSEGGPA